MAKAKLTREQKRSARRIAADWVSENPGGSLADARREIPVILKRSGIDPETIQLWIKFVLELIQQILAIFRAS